MELNCVSEVSDKPTAYLFRINGNNKIVVEMGTIERRGGSAWFIPINGCHQHVAFCPFEVYNRYIWTYVFDKDVFYLVRMIFVTNYVHKIDEYRKLIANHDKRISSLLKMKYDDVKF